MEEKLSKYITFNDLKDNNQRSCCGSVGLVVSLQHQDAGLIPSLEWWDKVSGIVAPAFWF